VWDVVKGTMIAGQSTAVDAPDLRLAGAPHRDTIYEKLTAPRACSRPASLT